MEMTYSLSLTHLYPEKLNIYGDMGNIIALKKRCHWRDISLTVKNYPIGGELSPETDLYFIGGGEDTEQEEVSHDLYEITSQLRKDVESNVVVLAICGGFQLFGKFFITGGGKKIQGAGILDLETHAPNEKVHDRCIGNTIISLNKELSSSMPLDTLVGFENHSGQTFLGENVNPLGKVLAGNGNNKQDRTEGGVYKNVYGTYLHGSLLPKNPHFADFLIQRALIRKYKKHIPLRAISNEEEIAAHKAILQMEDL